MATVALAAAPRIPDLPLDLMLAGAIGKLPRALGNPVSAHLEDTCPEDCDHTEIEDWGDRCEAALKAWDRFKSQLAAAQNGRATCRSSVRCR